MLNEPNVIAEIVTQAPALGVLIWAVTRLTNRIDSLAEKLGEHVSKTDTIHSAIMQHIKGV